MFKTSLYRVLNQKYSTCSNKNFKKLKEPNIKNIKTCIKTKKINDYKNKYLVKIFKSFMVIWF